MILIQNGDANEAEFVHLIREWYEACDARGIHIYDKLQRMQNLYNYLCAWFDFTDFPTSVKYIREMPIQTYQMIMQSISTRMQLWYHCPIPINQQSLSTLGAESFFSELTQMEFTGLSCPKSVDVPRLMSYCVVLITQGMTQTEDLNSTLLLQQPTYTIYWNPCLQVITLQLNLMSHTNVNKEHYQLHWLYLKLLQQEC